MPLFPIPGEFAVGEVNDVGQSAVIRRVDWRKLALCVLSVPPYSIRGHLTTVSSA